uniref:Peptidase S1 domain-containing protein n=1 Tax=Stomoxys calcitrans TaxID=35570 RepID=A0A1I8P244_STOCA
MRTLALKYILPTLILGCYSSLAEEERWDLDAYFEDLDNGPNTQDRIVGGANVPEGEFIKYQVSLQYLKNNTHRHFCGGSIISPSRILTAAHCVVGHGPEKFSVLAGVTNLKDPDGIRSQVTAIATHENYKPVNGNDIAILSIEPPFELDDTRLGTINVEYTDEVGKGEETILTGWGSTRHSRKSPHYPNELQILQFKTISNRDCKRKMSMLTDTEICAKSQRQTGACAGDSGGPLAMERNDEMIQVGIVSYGRARCGSDGLDVYTRITMFTDWIKERMCP